MKRKPTIPSAANADPTLHELQAHQIDLEIQNTELEEAKQRLESLLEKYTDLYDFTPVSYFSLDEKGVILEANLTGAALLGIDRSKLIQAGFSRFVTPASQPDFQDLLKRAFAGNGEEGCDFAITKQDGANFWARFRATAAISDRNGKPWCRMSVADLTSFRQSEAALRESQTHVRLANEATGVGIWEWNVLTGTILWDAQMFRNYGIEPTPSGIIQYTDWSSAVLPDELPETERILHDTLARRVQSRSEFRIHRRDDGEIRDIESVQTVRTNEQGEVEWLIGTNLDITERKRAETKERESEERFRAAVAAVSDIIWTNNSEGQMEGEQSVWGAFTGQRREEYQGYGWSKAVHPEDAQPTIDAWNLAVAEKRTFEFEHRVRRHDGEWRLCSIRAVPVPILREKSANGSASTQTSPSASGQRNRAPALSPSSNPRITPLLAKISMALLPVGITAQSACLVIRRRKRSVSQSRY